jgi:hypothetical protein
MTWIMIEHGAAEGLALHEETPNGAPEKRAPKRRKYANAGEKSENNRRLMICSVCKCAKEN